MLSKINAIEFAFVPDPSEEKLLLDRVIFTTRLAVTPPAVVKLPLAYNI